MVFLIEDNEAIRETVAAYLQLAGLKVKEFPGTDGVREAMDFQLPRLVIFDVMLPDGNGFALAKEIHALHPAMPFIFLTARESESDRITGLELGADDYIVKPFSPRELVLRVQAVLRRSSPAAETAAGEERPLKWRNGTHELAVDQAGHHAVKDGKEIGLTLAEWNILSTLIRRGRGITTREHILGEALDYLHDGSERTVNTHICNLRAKLGEGDWIETVRGVGYRFTGEP